MPIRPENRHHYGAAWRKVRATILARAGHCCEWCGRPDRRDVYVFPCGCWSILHGWTNASEVKLWRHVQLLCGGVHHELHSRLVTTILTIAHLNHTPGDDRPENLAALCQRCHLRYDREHHAKTRGKRRDAHK